MPVGHRTTFPRCARLVCTFTPAKRYHDYRTSRSSAFLHQGRHIGGGLVLLVGGLERLPASPPAAACLHRDNPYRDVAPSGVGCVQLPVVSDLRSPLGQEMTQSRQLPRRGNSDGLLEDVCVTVANVGQAHVCLLVLVGADEETAAVAPYDPMRRLKKRFGVLPPPPPAEAVLIAN